MNIQTKYNINDKVYVICDNRIIIVPIKSIEYKDNTVFYLWVGDWMGDNHNLYPEDRCFGSKAQLIEHVMSLKDLPL